MDNEVKRLTEGVSTSYQVLQYQKEYSQARSREIAVLADLNKDQADLWLVTGQLLEKRGIVVSGDPVANPNPVIVPVSVPAKQE
jgi:outer membrane protein TolC